jgi:serine/threonine protein kinase
VEYKESFIDNGMLCILMGFCEGGDLTSQVEQGRQASRHIEEPQILRWLCQALLALQYIHGKHVLHRDLKSSNFFLSKGGNLKMGDFGVATVLSCTRALAKTQIGTPSYLSPEVCQDKPYTWPSDIWAMGIILYELCALKLPFPEQSNFMVLIRAVCNDNPAPLPAIYSSFTRRLCSLMLVKSPGARPTAGAILSRPQFQNIIKQFFEEAKAKTAAGEQVSIVEIPPDQPPVEVGLQPPSNPDAAGLCSTQALDKMLDEVGGGTASIDKMLDDIDGGPQETESRGYKPSAAPAQVNKVGIGLPVLDAADECSELLAELGLDGLEASAAANLDDVPEDAVPSPTGGSLTQAELKLLHDGL